MEVGNAQLRLDASLYSFNKAKDIKSQEILSALGMTPQTQKAQSEIDSSIKQTSSNVTGQGMKLDIKA
jgi:hypothetical protein